MFAFIVLIATVTPAFASSTSTNFTLGTTEGTVRLIKSTSSATGSTAFGVGKSVTANRGAKVTLTCTKSGTTYTYTDSATAATSASNYSSTTARVTVYRPSSNYTVKTASSTHTVTSGSYSYKKSLAL